jgi:PilZ domain-containing protein
MRGRELRAEARIAVSRRGRLQSGETWFPCVVLDMSNRGFQMLCGRELEVGQLLDFRCELFPEKVLYCKVEIRHAGDEVLGTKIVEIDQRGHDLCQRFLEEQYSHKLDRSG